ncbi:T9SS type A sorting domain-containing protein [bacterium]|nr:T9SS type A sorting domain-containing protein [bacterium]
MNLGTGRALLSAILLILLSATLLHAADAGIVQRQTADVDSVVLRWALPTPLDLTNQVQPLVFDEGVELLWVIGQQRDSNYTWKTGILLIDGAGEFLEQLWSVERPGYTEPRAPVRMMGDMYYIRQKVMYNESGTVFYRQRLCLFGLEHPWYGSGSFFSPDEGHQVFAEASIVTPDTSIVSTGWFTRDGNGGTYVICKKMDWELWYQHTYYMEINGGQHRKRYLFPTEDNEVLLILGPDHQASPGSQIDLFRIKAEGSIGWSVQIGEASPVQQLFDVKRWGDNTLLLYQSQVLNTEAVSLTLVEVDSRGNLVNETMFEPEDAQSILDAKIFTQGWQEEEQIVVAVDILGEDQSRGNHHLDLYVMDDQYSPLWSGRYATPGTHASMLTMDPSGAILQAWVAEPLQDNPAYLVIRTVQAIGEEGELNLLPLEGIENIKPVLQKQAWTNEGYWILQGEYVERMNGYHQAWVASLAPIRSARGTTNNVAADPKPVAWSLIKARPNPFNASTTISYKLDQGENIRVSVYDLMGREVTQLDQGMKPAGNHRIQWNASDVPSGIYFIRLQGEVRQMTSKVVLLK